MPVVRTPFPHCKLVLSVAEVMEPTWGDFDPSTGSGHRFAVDVSETYALETKASAQYQSVFETGGDELLALYEVEDLHMGRLIGTRYAEVFKSRAPLVVEDPTVFGPAPHG